MEHTNQTSEFQLHPGIRQDLFDAIEYVKGDRKTNDVLGLKRPRVFLPKWAMDMVWTHCMVGVSTLSKHRFYKIEQLFGDPLLWGKYQGGTHKVFGHCLRHLEKSKMLPISCINPNMSGDKLYRIL